MSRLRLARDTFFLSYYLHELILLFSSNKNDTFLRKLGCCPSPLKLYGFPYYSLIFLIISDYFRFQVQGSSVEKTKWVIVKNKYMQIIMSYIHIDVSDEIHYKQE